MSGNALFSGQRLITMRLEGGVVGHPALIAIFNKDTS